MTTICPKKPWKPRSSSIGYYMQCEDRARQDRMYYEGTLPDHVRPPFDSPKASLGNCGHFVLQDGIRGVFSPRDCAFDFDRLTEASAEGLTDEEKQFGEYCDAFFDGDIDATIDAYKRGDPKIYQPLPSEWTDASRLFGHDIEITREKVRATATLAGAKVPRTPDDKPWLCETSLENEYLTGHTDFLSQDFTIVGDLKTTSKPVDRGRIKTEHMAQLASYHLLTGCQKSWILYVDSMRAAWSTLIWVDWTKAGPKRYAQHVKNFCEFLMSDLIYDLAFPRLGKHCGDGWCPFQSTCYNDIVPPPGTLYEVAKAKRATGQLVWGGKQL